jgi:hemerythrin-like metal-binding protein
MEFQWHDYLETGHSKIDNQHKLLVVYLKNLSDAFNGGKGIEEIEKTMDFLIAYTIKHFNDEEKLMAEYKYPEALLHRSYHEGFKKTVAEYIERLRTEGTSEQLAESILSTMGDWLANHIRGDDFAMAAYVKNKMGKND